MNAVNDKKELPYIPLGIFKLRLPGIHYKLEYVEFMQGLIIGTTSLASLPYMTEYMGLPYELAWSCVIIETFLYMLHCTLGDPVVPGWITPTLPLTLAYLSGFEKGPERTQAMIALQLLVAAVFLFMGITKLAEKFVSAIPTSIKGGILLAAPITVMQTQLGENGQLMKYPVAVLVGTCLLIFLSYSPLCQEKRKTNKFLDIMAKFGNLFPYMLAMVIGVAIKELAAPQIELGTIIKIPDFRGILESYSIFGVGFPKLSMFISALPLALISYVLAFGDFVTTETLIKEAKEAMKSLMGGMASFRLATFISVIIVPVVSFMNPVFPVGSGITLLFQAYVCARIGMEYCKSATDKSIAAIMAAVLAFKGSAWALIVGFGLNLLMSNYDSMIAKREEKKEEN